MASEKAAAVTTMPPAAILATRRQTGERAATQRSSQGGFFVEGVGVGDWGGILAPPSESNQWSGGGSDSHVYKIADKDSRLIAIIVFFPPAFCDLLCDSDSTKSSESVSSTRPTGPTSFPSEEVAIVALFQGMLEEAESTNSTIGS